MVAVLTRRQLGPRSVGVIVSPNGGPAGHQRRRGPAESADRGRARGASGMAPLAGLLIRVPAGSSCFREVRAQRLVIDVARKAADRQISVKPWEWAGLLMAHSHLPGFPRARAFLTTSGLEHPDMAVSAGEAGLSRGDGPC